MKSIPLQAVVGSSQVYAVGYDAGLRTLAVQYQARPGGGPGRLYHYANVTPAQYDLLMAAESMGTHLNAHFKDVQKHPCTPVT